jgi:excisionase family DNA binding protein
VAEILGVRPTTIALWAREGRITAYRTPGGHRRYTRAEVARIQAERSASPHDPQLIADAVRMYRQGWSIRQVAARFGMGYGPTRRLLRARTTLRPKSVPASRNQHGSSIDDFLPAELQAPQAPVIHAEETGTRSQRLNDRKQA